MLDFCDARRDRHGRVLRGRQDEIVHVVDRLRAVVLGKVAHNGRVHGACGRLFDFNRHSGYGRTIECLIGIALKHEVHAADAQGELDE